MAVSRFLGLLGTLAAVLCSPPSPPGSPPRLPGGTPWGAPWGTPPGPRAGSPGLPPGTPWGTTWGILLGHPSRRSFRGIPLRDPPGGPAPSRPVFRKWKIGLAQRIRFSIFLLRGDLPSLGPPGILLESSGGVLGCILGYPVGILGDKKPFTSAAGGPLQHLSQRRRCEAFLKWTSWGAIDAWVETVQA